MKSFDFSLFCSQNGNFNKVNGCASSNKYGGVM